MKAKGELPPDAPKRVVRPRKPTATYRPIIALDNSQLLVERTDTVTTVATLPAILLAEPSSIIVCQNFGPHLLRLIKSFGEDERFNYRVTPRYSTSRNGDGLPVRQTRIYDAVINFVGWSEVRKGEGRNRKRAKYHYPLDPVHFIRQSIDELLPDDNRPRIEKLLAWAQKVREFCLDQELEIKPSSGGLVAQLLRDPRFYPKARRKVPSLINDTARSRLPGNYYHLHAEPGRPYDAVYLDQTSAHHFAASCVQFPDANSLHAYGRWGTGNAERSTANLPGRSGRLLARGDSPLLDQPGLFHLRLSSRGVAESRFPPPWLRFTGARDVWVFSNELELIPEEVTIEGVIAALVADEAEHGMNAYAKFAMNEIRKRPSEKRWLKPTLHSTYGILAGRPTPFETGYYRAKGGTFTEYPLGAVSIPAYARRSKFAVESRIANVIHRGMIEAQVRKESLSFARMLTEADGQHVLAIYADSVFILNQRGKRPGYDDSLAPEEDQLERPLKLLPPPWRVAEYCDRLIFHTPTHFESRQLTRLPGITRDLELDRRRDRLIKRQIVVDSLMSKPTLPKGDQHVTSAHRASGRVGRNPGRRPSLSR